MYDLSPTLDVGVEPGSNLLVAGPPRTGKRALAFDILADGTEGGDGAIVVTTEDGAERVLKDFGSRVGYRGNPSPSSTRSRASGRSTPGPTTSGWSTPRRRAT